MSALCGLSSPRRPVTYLAVPSALARHLRQQQAAIPPLSTITPWTSTSTLLLPAHPLQRGKYVDLQPQSFVTRAQRLESVGRRAPPQASFPARTGAEAFPCPRVPMQPRNSPVLVQGDKRRRTAIQAQEEPSAGCNGSARSPPEARPASAGRCGERILSSSRTANDEAGKYPSAA